MLQQYIDNLRVTVGDIMRGTIPKFTGKKENEKKSRKRTTKGPRCTNGYKKRTTVISTCTECSPGPSHDDNSRGLNEEDSP